ncbi:N-acetyltransferase 14 [Tachyglossus aculeatus]|uniref:N-acetyltransferase 14 n=1 Tax=Tachyglossus aculeatus TaxID=9261 RepID=UPI0018F69020|nr:N-acetyltransferase 14 [Tachyglossus aculeatus]
MEPNHLSVREMREEEKPIVLELLKDGVKDAENRLALHALTRPPALLVLAALSSGLRFLLASFPLALLLPVLLAVGGLKMLLRRCWGTLPAPGGLGGPWVAVRGGEDVCGVVALAPRGPAAVELTRLAVSRWHRRRGIGLRLLGFAEGRARARGGQRLVVPVAAGAKGAAALLEASGYRAQEGWGWLGYTFVREFSKDL